MFEDARADMGRMIGASGDRIFVTSGGTESNNLAIFGTARRAKEGKRHIVLSAIEHSSVREACSRLAGSGWNVTVVPCDADGVVDVDVFNDAMTRDTALVSIMLVNNETGVVQPVRRVAATARARGIPVHVDAVQAAGKLGFDVGDIGADLLSVSGHKIYGPAGTGFLYVGEGVRLEPLLYGGGQQNGIRPGTQNVPGAVGLGVACRLAVERVESDRESIGILRTAFESAIVSRVNSAIINGVAVCRVCNTTSLTIPGVESGSLLAALDLEGVSVSSGSACSALGGGPSHVLVAMGMPPLLAMSTIRVSFGRHNTMADVDIAVDAIDRVVSRLRAG